MKSFSSNVLPSSWSPIPPLLSKCTVMYDIPFFVWWWWWWCLNLHLQLRAVRQSSVWEDFEHNQAVQNQLLEVAVSVSGHGSAQFRVHCIHWSFHGAYYPHAAIQQIIKLYASSVYWCGAHLFMNLQGNTYIMVIMAGAGSKIPTTLTQLNIAAARKHFEKFIPESA